jgi:hypothetical protein
MSLARSVKAHENLLLPWTELRKKLWWRRRSKTLHKELNGDSKIVLSNKSLLEDSGVYQLFN